MPPWANQLRSGTAFNGHDSSLQTISAQSQLSNLPRLNQSKSGIVMPPEPGIAYRQPIKLLSKPIVDSKPQAQEPQSQPAIHANTTSRIDEIVANRKNAVGDSNGTVAFSLRGSTQLHQPNPISAVCTFRVMRLISPGAWFYFSTNSSGKSY